MKARFAEFVPSLVRCIFVGDLIARAHIKMHVMYNTQLLEHNVVHCLSVTCAHILTFRLKNLCGHTEWHLMSSHFYSNLSLGRLKLACGSWSCG